MWFCPITDISQSVIIIIGNHHILVNPESAEPDGTVNKSFSVGKRYFNSPVDFLNKAKSVKESPLKISA